MNANELAQKIQAMDYDSALELAKKVDPDCENDDIWVAVLFGDNLQGALAAFADEIVGKPATSEEKAQTAQRVQAENELSRWFENHPSA
jgi:hypothetical protein